MAKHVVIFEVDAPDEMTPERIAGIFSDAMLEAFHRNYEDPQFPEFDCSDPVVEPGE